VNARLLLAVGVGDGIAALDRAGDLDHPAGQQQRLEQSGLAGTGVTGERDIADAFRGIRHDATLL
jgi:hypothetical protein